VVQTAAEVDCDLLVLPCEARRLDRSTHHEPRHIKCILSTPGSEIETEDLPNDTAIREGFYVLGGVDQQDVFE
jgi:hypothetical protein